MMRFGPIKAFLAKNKRILIPALIADIGILSALFFAWRFPPVEGLGTKVRLPVYQGAMTWACFIAFAALLLAALWYIISKKHVAWRWTSALRWTTVLLWAVGAILGFVAAYQTWDFSASQTSIIKIMSEDPRLVVQVVIMCLGLIVVVLPLVLENKRIRAIADVVFVALSAALLYWAMNTSGGVHPDSPVMNSDEFIIKFLFYLMFAGHLVSIAGLASLFVVVQESVEKGKKHEVVCT